MVAQTTGTRTYRPRSVSPGPRKGSPRWHARNALRGIRLKSGPGQLAWVILDAMNDDGTLPAHVDRRELCRRAGITVRSWSRHMPVLEAAELFTRRGTGQISRRTGRYAHVVLIGLDPRFSPPAEGSGLRKGQKPVPHGAVACEKDNVVPPTPLRAGTEGSASVSYIGTTCRGNDLATAQARKRTDADRRAAALAAEAAGQLSWDLKAQILNSWHGLARSRTDLPGIRYGAPARSSLPPPLADPVRDWPKLPASAWRIPEPDYAAYYASIGQARG